MKKKRILLLGGNYFPEPTGIGKYSGEMIDWFIRNGYDCTVITTYPYYPYWKVQPPYQKKSWWYTNEKIVKNNSILNVYRCPHYIPKNPTGGKRVLSDLSFFVSAFFRFFILLFQWKYDYVIAVAPPFQLGLLGVWYKWIRGGRLIYHIQDLQIDAAKELGMIRSKFLLNRMFGIERFILRKADHISTISEGMITKVAAKCNKPVVFFPNWVDITALYPISEKKALKDKFNFSPDDIIVLYSGAIGEKQGLEIILEAAQQLRHLAFHFLICGSGPYKDKLVEMVKKMELSNISFLPLQPKETFNEFLNMADIHLVLQKANANDLVMPSKLTAILSVGGLVIVSASKGTSLDIIISRHNMGLLIEPENIIELTTAISHAAAESFADKKNNARYFAEEYLAIEKVMPVFLQEIIVPGKAGTGVIKKQGKQINADSLN